MKIGINARFLTQPYTGIGQYTRNLILSLAKIDQDNEYFLFTPELTDLALPDHFHQMRVTEKDYRSASLRKAHWEHTLVPAEMEKWKVDRAHFLYPSNPWRKLSVPTIVTVHDVIPWRLPSYRARLRSKAYHWYARLALKKADHLITVSDFSKHEIRKLFKVEDKNITVIPLAPPLNDARLSVPSLPLRRDFFLYVGGYDERKNLPALIKAYLKHIANHNAIDLILVGGEGHGLESCLSDQYSERVAGQFVVKPKGQVIFTPPLSDHELTSLYRQAKALIHASTYEGFNLPLVEAMAQGLPIVASDIPVNREVTAGNALFMDPSSVDAIGNAMHQIIHDRALRLELAKNGRNRAKDFSWKKSAEDTLYVYNLFT